MSTKLLKKLATFVVALVLVACGEDPQSVPAPKPVAQLSVAPAERDLIVGDTSRLAAVALASDGTELPDRIIVWTSDQPSVAGVDAQGLVVAIGAGTAFVRASSAGKSGVATIRVTPPPGLPVPVITAISPDSAIVGGAAFTLGVRGTGFAAGAHVYWDGLRRVTTRVSDVELRAQIRQADITQPGVYAITVVNEDTDRAVSNARNFRVVVVPQPSLMSDVIYEGYPEESEELMYFELPGISPRRVKPGLSVMDPAPSPDGRQIAFVGVDGNQNHDIYVLELTRAGSFVRQLTSDSERDEQPAWSPDGRTIAFRSTRGQLGDIWIIDADGSNQRRITFDPLPGVVDDARPAWSPDGTRIVFSRGGGSQRYLWMVNADGSNERQVTSGLDRDDQPAWAPDGSAIAFSRTRVAERKAVIMQITPNGAPVTMAVEVEGRMPAWSVDSRMLAYVVIDANSRPDIGLMFRDGSHAGYLVLDPQHRVAGINPAWIKR